MAPPAVRGVERAVLYLQIDDMSGDHILSEEERINLARRGI